MKNTRFYCLHLLGILTFWAGQSTADDTLGTMLRQQSWEGIIGTWVEDGSTTSNTFSWKIKGMLIERVELSEDGRKTVELIGLNPGTEEIFHIGGNSEGHATSGKWEFEETGDAVVTLQVSGNDFKGNIVYRLHRVDENTLTVAVESTRIKGGETQKAKVKLRRVSKQALPSIEGDYEGTYGPDKAKGGAKVTVLGDGRFRAVLYSGGLPGRGWDGKNKIDLGSAAAQSDLVVFTAEGIVCGVSRGKVTLRTGEWTAVFDRVQSEEPSK